MTDDSMSPTPATPPATSPPMSADPSNTADVGYAAALEELESILRELEGSDIDVDRLADRVARAATLIDVCRERIARARVRIDEVVEGLEAEAAADGRGADRGSDPT